MPTLQNINGASLVPDASRGLNTLLQAFGTPETRATQARKAEAEGLRLDAIKGALGALTPGFAGPVDEAVQEVDPKARSRAMERLSIVAPEVAKAAEAVAASRDKRSRDAFRFEAEQGARQAELVSRQPDFASKQRVIRSLAQDAVRRGKPVDRMLQLLNKDETGLEIELQKMKLAAKDIDKVLGPKFVDVKNASGEVIAQREPESNRLVAASTERKPFTDIGKARADLKSGNINKDEFNLIKNAPKKAQSTVGKLIADRRAASNLYAPDSPQIKALDDAIKAESGGTNVKLSDINAIRGQYTRLAGDFITMRDAIGKVRSAATEPSAAGDLALIFNYMKVLDPGSVVRESEFATAQNAAGVPDRIRAMYNRVIDGERLAPTTRDDFVSTANRLFESQEVKQKALEDSFRDIATRSGMNPDDVVVNFRGKEDDEPSIAEGTTATKPETGEKLIFRNGQWQAL